MPQLTHATERGRGTLLHLRDALIALVAEKGFDAVTIKDITVRAGVDRTTFYLHATDKRDLFERSQHEVIDELMASGAAAGGPGGRIRAAFHHLAEHAPVYRTLLAASDPDIDQRLQDYLAQQINPLLQQLSVAPEVSRDLLAAYAATVFRSMAKWWLERDLPYSPDEIAAIVERLIFAGLTAFSA